MFSKYKLISNNMKSIDYPPHTGLNSNCRVLWRSQNLKEDGGTNYGHALRKAFQYFTNTADNATTKGQERGR